jgi:hypothetical protein
MCAPNTATYDPCAENWSECLRNPDWDFCSTFPSLCGIPEFYFKDLDALGKAICDSDKVFCTDAEKPESPDSAKVVCDNYD